MTIEMKILKAVLMLRRLGNTYHTKDEQIAEQKKWCREIEGYAERMDEWIESMSIDLAKTPEQLQKERDEAFEEFLKREAEYDLMEQEMYRDRERDEWDDLWDDRARSCGAKIFLI